MSYTYVFYLCLILIFLANLCLILIFLTFLCLILMDFGSFMSYTYHVPRPSLIGVGKIATTARRAGVAIWLLRQSKRGPESIIAGNFALIPHLQRLNIRFIGQIMLKYVFNFNFRQ